MPIRYLPLDPTQRAHQVCRSRSSSQSARAVTQKYHPHGHDKLPIPRATGWQSVAHSATSALLAHNEDVHAYALYMSSRTARCAQQMAPAHQKWGADSTRTNETAFNLAYNTDLPFFEYLSGKEDFMTDFAQYMRNVRK
ncbi:unnamed protein product [Penicillium egyptiacum]|uniref:Uncharacterized protein n=1 Tax=Penicillium egyptiacum TaxID=1303716 RepID=A0A9W4K8W3_9EURO|nr:unnamed protein product [Penicillium egyptiacum]